MSTSSVCRLPLVGLIVVYFAWGLPCLPAAEMGQKFQGNGFDSKIFRITGPNAAKLTHNESQGLRITLPAEHGMKPAVGLALHTAIKGDFEAVMEFEILQVDKPKGGTGAGVSIYLTMVSRTNDAATIWCVHRKDGHEFFSSHRATTPIGGKRQHSGGKPLQTLSKNGKLRLVRNGPTLHYSVAQENSITKFEEIFETELGEDDINMLRFAADNGGSPTLVDVRIKEVRVRADEFGAATQLPPPSRWSIWTLIGLGVLLLGLPGGYWFWKRQ